MVIQDLTWVCRAALPAVLMLSTGIADAQRLRPTPRPPGVGPDPAIAQRLQRYADTVSETVLRRYQDSLRFVEDSAFGDHQALMTGTYRQDARLGPRATIEAEEGSHLLTREQLAEGRIIARITNHDEQRYPKLGLEPRSVTYWWVEWRDGRGRSVFIATDPRTGRVLGRTERGLVVQTHEYGYRQALARFKWTERDDYAWATCGMNDCCYSQ